MLYSSMAAASLLHKYGLALSDEDCKQIHEQVDLKDLAEAILNKGAPYNRREAEALAMAAGGEDYDEGWEDSVLDKYAEFVHNYEYTYNDEALKVDPTTDTEQVHIGPMAQDLEKVNPAVVIEDPASGYKTVDTGRLALMNAGAIAELKRELEALKNG